MRAAKLKKKKFRALGKNNCGHVLRKERQKWLSWIKKKIENFFKGRKQKKSEINWEWKSSLSLSQQLFLSCNVLAVKMKIVSDTENSSFSSSRAFNRIRSSCKREKNSMLKEKKTSVIGEGFTHQVREKEITICFRISSMKSSNSVNFQGYSKRNIAYWNVKTRSEFFLNCVELKFIIMT